MIEKEIINKLADQWSLSGVTKGDVLLVHSSLKRLISFYLKQYDVKIDPEIVYKSLIEALGPDGTLILPLFNFDFPKAKFFDIRSSPSHMGALTEVGRQAIGSIRTGHPIYSFSVVGKHAKDFIGIDNRSGYGSDSPFAKILELNGKIAVIGLDDQNSMTSYHFVEERNDVPYRYFKDFNGEYVDPNGKSRQCVYSLFVRDVEKGVQTDVNRMMEYLWANNYYQGLRHDQGFGMRTILMKDLVEQTEKKIQEGKAIEYLYSIEK